MKKSRIRLSLLLTCMLLFSVSSAFAQGKGRPVDGKPSYEEMAARKSKMMQEKLGLSDKQYKEIYEINLEQAKYCKGMRPSPKCNGPKDGKCCKDCKCNSKGKSENCAKGGNKNMCCRTVASDSVRNVYKSKIAKVLTVAQYEKWDSIRSASCKDMVNGCKGKPCNKR